MTDVERPFLRAAIDALRQEGLEVSWQRSAAVTGGGPVDGLLDVRWVGGRHTFPVVIKHRLEPGTLGLLPAVSGVVVTGYVSPKLRLALSDAGWGFIDGAGNASLTAPGLVVRIETRRPPRESTPPVDLPFTKTGLPVTFVLLVRGSLDEGHTQRELGKLARRSLGTTNRVLQGLRRLGYLSKDGELREWQRLLDRWTEAYVVHRDLLTPGQRFSSDLWTSPKDFLATPVPQGAYLGSELAAHVRGFSIRPETGLVYCVPDARNTVIKTGHLRPDDQGWMELRSTFWGDSLLGLDTRTVPDVLIRADLLAQADPRLTALARGMARESDA